MGQITDINKYTQYWKDRYPEIYEGRTNEEIVGLVQERYPELNLPSYKDAISTDQSYQAPLQKEKHSKESLMYTNTDPASIDSWWLTSDFIPEKWQKEGALGGLISADFFKQSYNDSMAGMLFRTAHGKDKWDVSEDYNPAWYAQAGQFAVGMLSPLDAATMITTGALGKVVGVAAKTGLFGGTIARKTVERGLLTNYALKNKTAGTVLSKTVDGALNLGVGGGSFAASHAMVAETARQRTENPDKPVNISKALKVASDEFLHTFPMFAISGGFTQGIMGSIYGYSTAFASKNPTYQQKLTQAATSPLARVGTEAALFTSLPSVLGDPEAPKLGSNEWWAGLGTNFLVVGGMRAVGSFVEPKLVTKDGKKVTMEAYDVINTHVKMGETAAKTELKITENTAASLRKSGVEVPKILTDKIRELNNVISEGPKTLKQFKKDYDFIKEVNSKIDTDSAYLKAKKGSKENLEITKYQKLVNDHSSYMMGAIKEILDDDLAATLYKQMYDKTPNATELKMFTKGFENIKESIFSNQKAVDDYLTGNWLQSKDGINGGETTLKPVSVRDKTIIAGKTREAAKKEFETKTIIKQADDLGIQYKLTKAGNVKDKAKVIDEIYTQQRAINIQKQKEATSQAEIIAQKIKGGATYEEITAYNKSNNVLGKSGKSIPIISKSGISTANKNIISYVLDKLPKKRKHARGAKEARDLAKFVENKYKRNLDQLTPDEVARLGQDYIQKKVKADVYDKTRTELKKKYTDAQINQFYRNADYARDSLGELFRFGILDKIVGENIVANISKFNVRSEAKITLTGGDKGINKWINFVKTKAPKEIEFLPPRMGKPTDKNPLGKVLEPGKFISKEGAELAIKAAREGRVRPTEIANLQVKDILLGANNKPTGEILFKRVKGKGGAQRITTVDNPALAKALLKYSKKQKKTAEDKIFPFEDAKGFNSFVKYLSDNTDTKVMLRVEGVPKPFEQAGAGREYGRVFRALFDKEGGLEKAAKKRGEGEIAVKQYEAAPVKEKRAKRLPEEEIFQSKGDKAARDKFIKKVMKKNNLTEEQLKRTKLNPEVLGEFGEGIIKLQKKVWQPADFYHENLHRLKEFGRITKNKSLNKLIERGEKLAVKTKEYKDWKKKKINKNRDVEEFLADIAGGKASKMEFSKGLLPKINQFIKQLVSKVKVAFGVGNFKDISNVLAKRLQKGFSTEGVKFAKGQVKYSMKGMDEKQAVKYGKDILNEYFKSDELKQRGTRAKIEKYIGDIAQLGEDFKLSEANPIEIERFVSTLRSMDPAVIKNLPNKINWLKAFKDVESQRLIKNITEAKRTSLLKDLGVPEGNMYRASAKQLRDFTQVIETLDNVKKSSTAWIDQRMATGLVAKKIGDKFMSFKGTQHILPVVTVIESLGLNKLAQKIYDHVPAKLKYEGYLSTYEANMQRIYGNKKWDVVKDFTYLFDKERYFERLNNKYLTNKEKKFMNETFDINVEKKTMTAKAGKPGEIVRAHEKLMKKYKDRLYEVLKEVLNEAEFEKYLKDKPIEWVKNNIYVQRRLTKEAKLALDPDGAAYTNLIKSQEDAVARKYAKHYFDREVKKNYTKEQFEKKVQSLKDDGTALSVARGSMTELLSGYNANKYSPNFYKNRHSKLPEKIKVDGKMIEVYERTYASTTKDYGVGQAQFLANLEFFPEYISMKGFNIPNVSDLIPRLKKSERTRAAGKYIDNAVKDHLGIGKSDSTFPGGVRFLRTSTSLAAKLQLSGPTSGLKNSLTGNTQNLLAFRFRDFLGSLADVIHKDNRTYVKATGATEIGMRSIEVQGVAGRLDKVASQFFRYGGMKITENLNRYISVLAGKRDQLALSRTLQTAKEGTKVYKRAVNKLKSFYKLSDKDIALLKEFGMSGVEGLNAKTVRLHKRNLDKLYQKMNTYAHIHTQGAAINVFMPSWARSEVAQSALLYKRMAYAATANTARNMKIAYQNKSLFQPIAFGLGTYFSGEVMLGFYNYFYGQTMPKENSSEARQFATVLWKGEFLGILSEALNPFENKHPIDSMYPSLLSTASVMYNSTMSMLQGEKFVAQGINDIAKVTAGLYNGAYKLYSRGLLSKDSYASQSKRYSALYKDYIDEINDREEISVKNKTEMVFKQSKYMQAFRYVFDSGYKKDDFGNSLGKWYMMCLFSRANDYYYKKFTEDGIPVNTPKEALAEAVKQMEKSLVDLNPNKAAVTAKTKKAQAKQIIKGKNFIDWLDDKEKLSPGLIKLNKQYKERYKLTQESIKEYIKTGNLEKDLKYYGISIADILK